MNKKQKKIVRDRQALSKTMSYLITERGRKPTTVAQTAKRFGISKQAAAARLSELSSQSMATRVARGIYSASTPAHPQAQRETLDDLLAHLLKERGEIDAKIIRVKETIALKKEWLGGKGKK